MATNNNNNDGVYNAHNVFRVLQVLTLIPAWALMAAIISWYNENDVKTPGGVMALFIIPLLASVWAFCILLAVLRARNTALWITFWDLVAMAALIAAVATTADIANYECSATQTQNAQTVYVTPDGQRITATNSAILDGENDGDDLWDQSDYCNLIKAAWGLAIANIIMFFITAILAAIVWKNNRNPKRTVVVEERVRPPVVHEKIYPEDYPRRPRRARHSRSHGSRSSRASRGRTYVVDDGLV